MCNPALQLNHSYFSSKIWLIRLANLQQTVFIHFFNFTGFHNQSGFLYGKRGGRYGVDKTTENRCCKQWLPLKNLAWMLLQRQMDGIFTLKELKMAQKAFLFGQHVSTLLPTDFGTTAGSRSTVTHG